MVSFPSIRSVCFLGFCFLSVRVERFAQELFLFALLNHVMCVV